MKEKFYNVWYTIDGCWTRYVLDCYDSRSHLSAPTDPAPLSKEDADRLLEQIRARAWGTPSEQDYEVRPIRIKKVIPNFPLDPTLHILEAGYIQDRQRKRS